MQDPAPRRGLVVLVALLIVGVVTATGLTLVDNMADTVDPQEEPQVVSIHLDPSDIIRYDAPGDSWAPYDGREIEIDLASLIVEIDSRELLVDPPDRIEIDLGSLLVDPPDLGSLLVDPPDLGSLLVDPDSREQHTNDQQIEIGNHTL